LRVVQVLSERAQAYDRGLKFAAYRQIEALHIPTAAASRSSGATSAATSNSSTRPGKPS
jgi:hypothetical protein